MKLLGTPFFVLIVSFATLCLAGIPISQAITRLPACGTTCILQSITSSPCNLVTNTTCLCNNNDLYGLVQDCVLANCTGPDAIKTGLVQAQVCDLPLRLLKFDIHIAGILQGLAILCICLRIFSRWYTMDRTGLDDWIAIIILPLYFGFVFCGHYAGQLAFGIDIWFVEPDAVTEALKAFYVGETLYVLLLGLTKASMLCFYLRVFPHQGVRRAILVGLGLVVTSTATLLLLQVFQCVPVSLFWEGWREGLAFLAGDRRCVNINALALAVAAISIALDMVILAIPIPVVIKLDRQIRSKAAGMFGLGIFILMTSSVRIPYIVEFGDSRNPTWDATDALIWSGIEIAVSIIVISLPAIRVLLRVMFPRGGAAREGLPPIESARGRTFRQRLSSINGSAEFRPNLRGGASRVAEGSRAIELKDTKFSTGTASSSQMETKFTTSTFSTVTVTDERGGEMDGGRGSDRGSHIAHHMKTAPGHARGG
ncbi:hypothetical protein RB597_010439 [Gaeumannomyces tritici]